MQLVHCHSPITSSFN